ncbi:MAG: hypothetical protein MMC33_007742 [Icmadophila ericetorum]|nr:hypothetical protein [Icmadophila ericetorum]
MTDPDDAPVKAAPLKWTTQLNVLHPQATKRLQGDKVILPPSALEQLLSAATTNVPIEAQPQIYSRAYNPFNPQSFTRPQMFERQQELPTPLTFRLVNPENGSVVYAGIREFSAEEGTIGLSSFLHQSLGLKNDREEVHDGLSNGDAIDLTHEAPKLTIHVQELPKGTFVRFRPLEAGYDPEDWKALLERYMRDTFTTLTKGEILSVHSGKDEYRFLVDKISPDGNAICIVDTDLEVDIEALNEEQARETLKKRLEKSGRPLGSQGGNSKGGDLFIDKAEIGQVQHGQYVDYALREWDCSKTIEFELTSADSEQPVDIFISPLSHYQRSRPRQYEHVLSDVSERPTKRIRLQPTNTALEGAEALYIATHAYASPDEQVEGPQMLRYSLSISQVEALSTSVEDDVEMANGTSHSPEDVQCKNCHQWVPKRTLFLHENFCLRNNILCPHCPEVFKKSSPEWKSHWHCSYDSVHGNNFLSHQKHDALYHTPQSCAKCGHEAPNIRELASHCTSTCPGKLILCQFCHLLVPQQGPDDPSPTDPEVILSDLTPHELADGARTTECHLCGKIVRLRDMATHLRHHDLERLSRTAPKICRNANCGRTLDGVGPNGHIKHATPNPSDLGLESVCFGPLYNSMFDPEGKALKRRVERRYLTQLITGCGRGWCRNPYCKTGRKHLGLENSGAPGGTGGGITSKDALLMIRPILEGLGDLKFLLHFCTDEASQRGRVLAEMLAAEGSGSTAEGTDSKGKGKARDGTESTKGGYDLEWCIAALEATNGDLGSARTWLGNWAVSRGEVKR